MRVNCVSDTIMEFPPISSAIRAISCMPPGALERSAVTRSKPPRRCIKVPKMRFIASMPKNKRMIGRINLYISPISDFLMRLPINIPEKICNHTFISVGILPFWKMRLQMITVIREPVNAAAGRRNLLAVNPPIVPHKMVKKI